MGEPAEIDLILRAAAIGDEIVKIAETVGQDVAANHLALGIEILRAHANCLSQLCERGRH